MSYYEPNELTVGIGRATLTGSFGGLFLLFLIVTASDRAALDLNELLWLPFVLVVYGTFSLPFVGFGLVIFGLPVRFLLKGYEQRIWILPLVLVWGSIAAKLQFYFMQRVIFFGSSIDNLLDWKDPALAWGLSAAFGFWFFGRPDAPPAEE